jgi:hypothetical protein
MVDRKLAAQKKGLAKFVKLLKTKSTMELDTKDWVLTIKVDVKKMKVREYDEFMFMLESNLFDD